jgi:hypothetical protein
VQENQIKEELEKKIEKLREQFDAQKSEAEKSKVKVEEVRKFVYFEKSSVSEMSFQCGYSQQQCVEVIRVIIQTIRLSHGVHAKLTCQIFSVKIINNGIYFECAKVMDVARSVSPRVQFSVYSVRQNSVQTHPVIQ